jgi:hypothetical protein
MNEPTPGLRHTFALDHSVDALATRGNQRNEQLEAYFRRQLVEQQSHFTNSNTLDTSSLKAYTQQTAQLRQRLLESMGGWPERPSQTRAQVEELGETGAGRLYRVSIWVVEEVEMPTLLLVPHGAAQNPRPAVICQHGYAGSPEWMMGFGASGQFNYTNGVGRRLADAGYVVIASQIVCSPPGVGKDRVRLDRLARLANRSLLGVTIQAT